MSPRRQSWFWIAGVALTVLPLVLFLLPVGGRSFGVMISGECRGWRLWSDLSAVTWLAWLRGLPVLVVAPAFVVWARTRWRWIGGLTAGFLVVNALLDPGLMAYDVVRQGERCAQTWEATGLWVWKLWYVVPGILIASTLYRRGRVLRGAVAAGVLLCVGAAAGDRGPVRVVATGAEECRGVRMAVPARNESMVRAIGRLSMHERERAFVCSFRAAGDERADGELLSAGRRVCRDFSPESYGRLGGRHAPPGVAYLCPEEAGRRAPMGLTRSAEQMERDAARRQARLDGHCRRGVRASDRRLTKAVSPGEAVSYIVGAADYMESEEVATSHRVEVYRRSVVVLTGDDLYVCLTVRRAGSRPPVEREGWDRVVEAGIDGTRVQVGSMEGDFGFPVLGSGPSRVRVHVRERRSPYAELPGERHLVVVYPGSSKRTAVYVE